MNTIIEEVAEATDLPYAAGTQENDQVENPRIEMEDGGSAVVAIGEQPPDAKSEDVPSLPSKEQALAVEPSKIQTGMVQVTRLRPYARNAEIYEELEDALFTENIRNNGILNDLVVTEDGEVLGGNRRLREAQRLGLPEVSVKVTTCKTEDEKMLRVLDDNVQRVKSNVEVVREYTERLKVETRAAAVRKVEAGKKGKGKAEEVEIFTPPADEAGKARDKAAKELNLSGVTAEKGRKVLEAVAKARAEGDTESAEELLLKLNDDGFHSAFKRAEAIGLIVKAPPKDTKTKGVAQPKVPALPSTDEKAEVTPGSDPAPAIEIVAHDEEASDVQIVAAYINAVALLDNLDVQTLTRDLKENLLRAHSEADTWFGYSAAVLEEYGEEEGEEED